MDGLRLSAQNSLPSVPSESLEDNELQPGLNCRISTGVTDSRYYVKAPCKELWETASVHAADLKSLTEVKKALDFLQFEQMDD